MLIFIRSMAGVKLEQYLESNYEAYQDIKKIIEMEQIECDFKSKYCLCRSK